MPTLKDVAALAGVSAATVSLYLNGKSAGRISPQKQQEIEAALNQLSYQPGAAAKRLRGLGNGPDSYNIAVYWASDTRSALLGKVISGIQSSLVEHHTANLFHIVICPYTPNELYREKSLTDTEHFHYDAAIIANTTAIDMQYLNSILPPIPVVLLNRSLPQYHTVTIPNQQMGAEMADLIADHGFSEVAVFRSHTPYLATDERVIGFINQCRSRAVSLPNQALIYTEDSADGGIRAAKTLLSLEHHPNVVFCDSDSIAIGALSWFQSQNLSVPQDMSIVSLSLNNSSITQCLTPPLTVSEIPLKQMAKGCMDCITELLTGSHQNTEPIHRQLETNIILRKSLK